MKRRLGDELLGFPTLAVSRDGKTRLMLKLSSDMERVWLSDSGDVTVEIKVGAKWLVSDQYHVSQAIVPDLFRARDCRFCQEEVQTAPPDWRFCPHCGAAIQRRAPKRRTPKGS